jgi:hypothetical protein
VLTKCTWIAARASYYEESKWETVARRKRVGESRWLLWREGVVTVVSVTVLLGHQALRNNSMEEGSGSAGNTEVERTHVTTVLKKRPIVDLHVPACATGVVSILFLPPQLSSTASPPGTWSTNSSLSKWSFSSRLIQHIL